MRRSWVGLVASLSLIGAASAAPAVVPIQGVAFPNLRAPGTGTNYGTLDPYPTIDDFGHVSFTGTTNNNLQAVWSGPPSGVSLVAIENGPVPDAPGQTFRTMPGFYLDVEHGGPLVYSGVIDTPPTAPILRAAWLVSPGGGQQRLAQTGMEAPGTSGAVYASAPASVDLNLSGQYAFLSVLQTGGSVTAANARGIWANTGGGLRLVARDGDPVPGMPAGVTWNGLTSYPAIAPDGTISFFANLSNNQSGIFSVTGSIVTPLVLSNRNGVGTIPPQQPRVNASDELTFSDDNNIWLKTASGLRKVATAGSSVVGGAKLTKVFAAPHVSDDGRVFFQASTGGEPGLYQATPAGVITPIAVPGQQVPGEPAGWKFNTIEYVQYNRRGQVAFDARVTMPSGNVEIGDLFATDFNGTLIPVAVEGTQYTLNSGLTDTIGSTQLDPFTDVDRTALNDLGQLAFTAFTDHGNNAVLVANVPEPSMAVVALSIGMLVLRLPRGTGFQPVAGNK